jgi:hypothetical protein
VRPLLTTTGLMAPEAYTLKAALDDWIAHEPEAQIRLRAAKAYDEHQDRNLGAAKRLFGVKNGAEWGGLVGPLRGRVVLMPCLFP